MPVRENEDYEDIKASIRFGLFLASCSAFSIAALAFVGRQYDIAVTLLLAAIYLRLPLGLR